MSILKAFAALVCVCLAAAVAVGAETGPHVAIPQTGFLGFNYVSAIDADQQNIFIVDTVVANSPAMGRLSRGDVLRSVNGTPATAADEFERVINAAKEGDVLTFVLQRGERQKALALQVAVLSDGRATSLEDLKTRPASSPEALGIRKIVYIPQPLCYRGFGGSEALPLTPAPGVSTVPTSQTQGCRQTAEPCLAMFLVKQSTVKTTVQRGEWIYRLDGDWTRLTFDDENACRRALPKGSIAEAQK